MFLPGSDRRRDEGEIWIIRNERLRKHRLPNSLDGSAVDRVAYAIDSSSAAREIGCNLDRSRFDPFHRLHRPRVNHHCIGFLMYQDDVEHIQWIDWTDTRDKCFLRLTVQRLGREPAAVNFASLLHELLQTLIHEKVTGKRFVSDRGESTLGTHGDARAIQQDRGFVALTQKASGNQGVNN